MKVKCAWCGRDMGEKPPYDNKEVSHTICADCLKKQQMGGE